MIILTEAQIAAASVDPESGVTAMRMINAILRALGGAGGEPGQDASTVFNALLVADDGYRRVDVTFDDGADDCITIKIGPYTGP